MCNGGEAALMAALACSRQATRDEEAFEHTAHAVCCKRHELCDASQRHGLHTSLNTADNGADDNVQKSESLRNQKCPFKQQE